MGGGVGSLARYFFSVWIGGLWNGTFPLGTFLINLIGCFLIGFLGGAAERVTIDPPVRLLLQVGFLGGFTTFSSFGLETVQLARRGEGLLATTNVLGSNLLGIGFVVVGFLAAKAIWSSLPKIR